MRISDWSSDVCFSDLIEMLGLQLLQCPGSTERHCKAWRQLGPDHRADQIIERSEDSRPPAVFLSQQAEVLRMGVGVAADDVEDGGIDQLQHPQRRPCCRLAQPREPVPQHPHALPPLFSAPRNPKPPPKNPP